MSFCCSRRQETVLTPRQLNPSLPLELGAAEGEKNSPLLFRVSAFETEPALCSAISSQLVSLSLKGRISNLLQISIPTWCFLLTNDLISVFAVEEAKWLNLTLRVQTHTLLKPINFSHQWLERNCLPPAQYFYLSFLPHNWVLVFFPELSLAMLFIKACFLSPQILLCLSLSV